MQTDWILSAQRAREAGPDALSLLLLEARNLLLVRQAELAAAQPSLVPPVERTTADLDALIDELADAAAVGGHSPLAKGSVWWQGQIALMADDIAAERLAVQAQRAGVPLNSLASREPRAFAPREPIGVSFSHITLGSVVRSPDGSTTAFAPPNEQPAHPVDVPGFEIDAAPVTWGQFLEFVEDGGYDDWSHFSPQGRQWLQDTTQNLTGAGAEPPEPRRAPRYVAQTRGAVVVQRFGRALRVRLNEPVMHLSFWEAQAWCQWARRRLPTEAEWVAAATQAARRGFVWGDVWEWTATRYRPFTGAAATDRSGGSYQPESQVQSQAVDERIDDCQVVKGGSFASSERLKHPQFRGYLRPASDAPFVGFRSCSV